MIAKFNGSKLTDLELNTEGFSHNKSGILECVGAEKRRAEYAAHSHIVLRIRAWQDTVTLHIENPDPENEKQYKKLRKLLREQHIVPVYVPSVTVSSYYHVTRRHTCLYGLRLSCKSFQLLS